MIGVQYRQCLVSRLKDQEKFDFLCFLARGLLYIVKLKGLYGVVVLIIYRR